MKHVALILMGILVVASDIKAEKVDDILDRLEKKLLESKQESLLLNDNWNKPLIPQKQDKVSAEPKVITGNLPSQSDLKEIGLALDNVDREVERLSADVEKLKRIIVSDSQTNSLINIYIEVTKPSEASLREIAIELDQFPIYKLSPDVGIWLPRSKIAVFSGPLNPGNHSISLSGRIARVLDKNVAIEDNVFHLLDQKFSLVIPQGKVRKEITIKLEPVEDKNFNAKAILVEKNI